MTKLRILIWILFFLAIEIGGAIEHFGYSNESSLLNLDPVSDNVKGPIPYMLNKLESDLEDPEVSRNRLIEKTEFGEVVGKVTHNSLDHDSKQVRNLMPEIKISKHYWVSTSQKGYVLAVAITLLAGFIFGIMAFK